ncbi:hypothetical protein HG531_002982 [Fusarium graminearum]|nr:hypothetical protein HG531_002982 [Fusarium graminearum]
MGAVFVATLVVVLILLDNVVVDSSASRSCDSLGLAVHEILSENTQIKKKGDETAREPAQVDQNVFAIDVTSLARPAFVVLALGIIGEDRQDISKDLARKAKVEAILTSLIMVAVIFAMRSFLTQEPAYDTSGNDHHHDDGVPHNGLKDGRGSRSSIFGDMRDGRRQTRPV